MTDGEKGYILKRIVRGPCVLLVKIKLKINNVKRQKK